MRYRIPAVAITVLLVLICLFSTTAIAHNVSKRDVAFVQSSHGSVISAFMYLGAKHMVPGYDHLAFLIGDELQESDLAKNGLATNIVSFNVGVEIGQVLALTAVLIALGVWCTRSGVVRHIFATNVALMTVGLLLTEYQIGGCYLAR